MRLSKPFSSPDQAENNGLIDLLDKYIKSSDNLLPFQAYLQYLEDESLDVFSTISCVKNQTIPASTGNNQFTESVSTQSNLAVQNPTHKSNSNLASTLVAISKKESKASGSSETSSTSSGSPEQEIILAQKLYKIIISIDYSTQISNIDFIQTSLTKVFEKISVEYDEFYRSCMQIEPTIYVTVILWNSSFFQCPQNDLQKKAYSPTDILDDEFVPFTILCHAKRLLKSNVTEIAAFIFDRFNESKAVFLKLLKQMQDNQSSVAAAAAATKANGLVVNTDMGVKSKKEQLMKKDSQHWRGSAQSELGAFEQLLTNIIRMFSFFRWVNSRFLYVRALMWTSFKFDFIISLMFLRAF